MNQRRKRLANEIYKLLLMRYDFEMNCFCIILSREKKPRIVLFSINLSLSLPIFLFCLVVGWQWVNFPFFNPPKLLISVVLCTSFLRPLKVDDALVVMDTMQVV